MSARNEHRGRLAGKSLYGAPAEVLAKRYGVTRGAIYKARAYVPLKERNTLDGADLRRPTEDLIRDYGVTSKEVDTARRRALDAADLTRSTASLVAEFGCHRNTVWAAKKKAGIPTPPVTRFASGGAPTIAARVRTIAPVVVAPLPTFADADLVAAVDEELAICPAPYVAALIVAKRLRLPMDRVLVVAESRCGMAAK